ncbi:MAG: sterol desaturase family protein [Bacteroidetes bacterium]|nr:sterol desaturase family protein [Bacteroidota bacterium]
MSLVLNIGIVLLGFVLMEAAAWATHKYIMHGFMWRWHKSHHESREGTYEKNDLFGVVFAILSASLIIFGSIDGLDWRFYLGIGILLYGIAYFLVHDVFVHQRLPLLKKTKSTYFQAMRFAHKIHHKVSSKEGAEAFGFLYVSKKYLDKYSHKK